ncbi:MAG: c-type cytochrome [Actinobacteria bacterium]|uniref:Unannotated protein n=1 Tax=freshwater metagenome TaxID=449393 RepID=A0A6J6PYG1_9ZZZZ|nr:c-type cytochrome [Actinomycetota bacterium]
MTEHPITATPLPEGADRAYAKSVAFRYLIASTVILGASGLLGMVLRDSQAGAGRVPDAWYYAIMTAHGLGAFVGWGAFAVMGLAWWVLAEAGFPVRRFGRWMAEATWWLMVGGVFGVVVTCLLFKFGGSWVFLYPISLYGSGVWGKWTAFFFTFSVLLAGLAIVTWCVGILHTVVGPALGAVSKNPINRYFTSIGWGYLAPKKFASNGKGVPYAVIPLAVIALDMIIATLPLAVMLILLLVHTFVASVTVDPLWAKNILWWFGHPVVYLLLFPAVAVYYTLVPKKAGRPLVAGNIIAIGWAIAVTANVIVWAHHVYIDYPSGTIQASLNVISQPLTFSVTVVSALSLYSLFFTIFRSKYKWDTVGTALFLGLFSWFSAGLSGIANATIAFDQVVHNTLFIVGHFHQMALEGIGFAIIAATYAWLPEFTGKKLYSDRMGRWHVWLTFVFANLNSIVWMDQGIHGAPRRYAVVPHHWNSLNEWAVPVTFILVLSQLLFAWNIIQTIRGKGENRKVVTWQQAAPAVVAKTVVLAGLLGAIITGGWALGRHVGETPAAASTTPAASVPATIGGGDVASGKTLFTATGCGGCHTLAAAGAAGTVGPNLDTSKPSFGKTVDRVTEGEGAMPPYSSQLTGQQIKDIAAFITGSTGGTDDSED